VVEDVVDNYLETESVGLLDEGDGVVEVTKKWVDVGVVGNVVAPISHRTFEERGKPDGVYPECLREIVQPGVDAGQIAVTVSVGVGETQRVDLVDDRLAPPRDALGFWSRHWKAA
jgi:hypothetical protein